MFVCSFVPRALLDLQNKFKKEIGSLDLDVVDKDKLASGAKINAIFHERYNSRIICLKRLAYLLNVIFVYYSLPDEMSKIPHDKDQLHRQIKNIIANLHGATNGLYPPFKAFEIIVIEQIAQLEEPILLILNLVIDELKNAIQNCTQSVSVLFGIFYNPQNITNDFLFAMIALDTKISKVPRLY